MATKLPLVIKELSYSYEHKKVLKDVNGVFYEGVFYGIAGPNGSGKTTWMKLMAGLFKDYNKGIYIFGRELSKLSRVEIARKISFVPQMFNMKYAFTVEEIVMMGRYPYIKHMGTPTHEDYEYVTETLKETNLYELKHRYVNELSGGELQRVVIARAIVQDTEIILLDEPISHLDIRHQYEIITLLKKLCKEKNKTIIAVLHDLNVTMNHCDHVMLMGDGRVLEQGEPHRVLTEESLQNIYGVKVKIIENDGHRWITW